MNAVGASAIRSRCAVAALFFANGFGFGTWVAHLPLFKVRLGLSDGLLGLALLGVAIASLVSMPLVGATIARSGSRRTCAVMSLAGSLVLVLPFFAPTYAAFVVAAIAIGALYSGFDVTINAQAVAVEAAVARPIMSSFHAAFSFGGLAGSVVSAVLIARHVTFAATGISVAIANVVICVAAYPWLAADAHAAVTSAGDARPSLRSLQPVALLGALAFLGLVGEGAMADWTGIYLRSSLAATAAASAFGFGAFSIAMALGRALGDRVVAALGAEMTVAGGATLAALALAAALASHTAWTAYAGFALVGLGLANVIPVLFSAAGRAAGLRPGVGIAVISTIGYGGFVVGPTAIGFTSDAVGIRLALGLVVITIATIALLAHRALPSRGATA